MYLAMLDKLVSYSEAYYECEAGLTYGARILRYDRARERTHRRLMRLHCLTGNRTAALRQYGRCVTALDEELGVKPAKRTVALYEQIRKDQFSAPAPIPYEVSVAPKAAASPLSEVLEHLKHLREILTDVQRQVHQDIQTVETILNDQR
jgi:DNA-binding SARP family transcriptional activator